MRTFSVQIPIAGYVYTEVEAEDEEAAIDAALYQSYTHDDIEEWETYRVLCEGNVLYADVNHVSAEEL